MGGGRTVASTAAAPDVMAAWLRSAAGALGWLCRAPTGAASGTPPDPQGCCQRKLRDHRLRAASLHARPGLPARRAAPCGTAGRGFSMLAEANKTYRRVT